MASGTDAQILADANARLGKKYKSIEEYLTDNGRLKKDGVGYKRRLTALENARGKAKREKFVGGEQWTDYITSKYGWLVDIYNTVPEVADIIRNGYIKNQPVNELQQAIVNSAWAKSLQTGEYEYRKAVATNDRSYLDQVATRERDVRNVAAKGGFTLPEDQIKYLASGSLKGGWDAQQISDEVGKAAVAAAKAGTTPMTQAPTGATPTALQGTANAGAIKELGRKYGINLNDRVVESYVQGLLQGTLDQQQIVDQLRNQAKSLYPSLANQLDAGTVEDATQSYKSIAAQVLEIDPTQVDFSNPNKFGRLLTYTDPKSGEARLMNATEWSQYLRSLPDWQKTGDAKKTYSGLIDTINNIYGKVG